MGFAPSGNFKSCLALGDGGVPLGHVLHVGEGGGQLVGGDLDDGRDAVDLLAGLVLAHLDAIARVVLLGLLPLHGGVRGGNLDGLLEGLVGEGEVLFVGLGHFLFFIR